MKRPGAWTARTGSHDPAPADPDPRVDADAYRRLIAAQEEALAGQAELVARLKEQARKLDLEQIRDSARTQLGPPPEEQELSTYDQHPADLATDTVEREQHLSVIEMAEASLRDVDIAARLGGEEFAVLLPETDEIGAAGVAERLRAGLAALDLEDPEGGRFSVTASFGVAVYPQARSSDELLTLGDAALYRAKAEGKNRVVLAPARP